MAHESTFKLTFGSEVLVAVGDLVEEEPDFSRAPGSPQRANYLRAKSARFFHGLHLSHSFSWSIRREFASIAEARAYQWTRPADLPTGKHTLTIEDSGITATLLDAHLTQFEVSHLPGQEGIILESVSVLGGDYATTGSVDIPAEDPTPAAPLPITVPGEGTYYVTNGSVIQMGKLDQNVRFKADGTMQIFDTSAPGWRTIWIDNGNPQLGPAES